MVTVVCGRNFADRFVSLEPRNVPVTIRTGTTAKRTVAAPSIKRFRTPTAFLLTVTAFNSSEPMPYEQSVSDTIPDSNPQVKSDYGYETAQAQRISIRWPTFWRYPLRSLRFFSTAITLIAAQKFCAEPFNFTVSANHGAATKLRLLLLPALLPDLLRFSSADQLSVFTACFAHPYRRQP